MSAGERKQPSEKNEYWIPNLQISKKVIIKEIQYYLGPDSTARAYCHEGEGGFLITTPGGCLTDEQIDDLCRKSMEMYEQQAAARSKRDSDKQLKRPLHQPILFPRGSRYTESARRRQSDDRSEGSGRRRSGDRRYEGRDRY